MSRRSGSTLSRRIWNLVLTRFDSISPCRFQAGISLFNSPHSRCSRAGRLHCVSNASVRLPGFALIHDGLKHLSAGAGGLPVLFSSACGDNSAGLSNVMTTRISFATFRQISAARTVEIHAFGFKARLMPSDTQALASFAAAVADGVSVK